MQPNRQEQIDRLYHAALERDPSERLAFLQSHCQDQEILKEVGSLLEYQQKGEALLEHAPWKAELSHTSAGQSARAFLPEGSRLGRYEIFSVIGAGGMGEVYRARDSRLDREVAIKILPESLARDASRVMRFEREARAASALNHPNIVSVYDIGKENDLSYIVSELAEGETLAASLASGAAKEAPGSSGMAPDILLEVAIQIADALEAAHAKGILHRDIKPANIMLTPRWQVKILDFGIAKIMRSSALISSTPASTDTMLTVPGATMGTLGYMSPEQARGDEPDARSDLFSFGAVLYEMATGRRAFSGKTPAMIFAAILSYTPPMAAGALGPIIGKAIEKDREARWASAAEMKAALVELRQQPGWAPGPRARDRSTGKKHLRLALVIALAAAAAGSTIWLMRPRGASRTAGPGVASTVLARRSVAVMGFKNLTGREDAAWLSAALSEMFVSELAAGEKLRTTPGESVSRAKIDLALPDADGYGAKTLERIHQTLGADFIVLGSYYYAGKEAGGQVRLDLRLQDSRAGDTVASISTSGTDAQLLDLVSRTGVQLRQKLGVEEATPVQETAVRAELPSNPEAYRLYAEGLKRLRLYDGLTARDLLMHAVKEEPANAMIHAALAQVWRSLGYDEKARQESKQALGLSNGLSREKRLLIEGNYRQSTREWDKAADVFGALFRFFPDNLDYGLRLMAVQRSGGNGKAALATAAALRKLPPPERDDPRIDIEEANSADTLGDFQAAMPLSLAAVQKSEAQSAGLLAARARLTLGWDLDRLGRLQEAAAVLALARDAFSRGGDYASAGQAFMAMAAVFYDQGNMAGAAHLYQEALALYRRVGNQRGVAQALNSSGNIYYDQGNLNAAKKVYEEALAIQRETGSRGDLSGTLGNIANVLDGQGDLAGAQKMHEEALEHFQETGDKRGMSSTSSNLGLLRYEQGDLAGAQSYYERALQITAETGYKRGRGYALIGLGQVALARGNLADTRAKYEEALALRQAMGDEFKVASTRVAIAELVVEEGRGAEAAASFRNLAEVLHKAKSEDEECEATAMLASTLAAQGKTGEALAALRRARQMQSKGSSFALRPILALAEARVNIAQGAAAAQAGRGKLAAALTEATRRGYVGFSFEIRLTLAQLDFKFGDKAAARASLEALETEARAKGYGLVARKALALKRS